MIDNNLSIGVGVDKSTKNSNSKDIIDLQILFNKKNSFFKNVIENTFLYIQKNKILNIINFGEVNNATDSLTEVNNKLKELTLQTQNITNINNGEQIINGLQNINNELSTLFKSFGTEKLDELLCVCFGHNPINFSKISETDRLKFDLLIKYFHPISYKIFLAKTDKYDTELNDNLKNLDCINISTKVKSFYLKVHGIQVSIHNTKDNKILIITGMVDDICIEILNHAYINNKIKHTYDNIPKDDDFLDKYFTRFISSLTLKDFLINNNIDLYSKFLGYKSNINSLQIKSISTTMNDFLSSELYLKRSLLIQLLIFDDKSVNKYLAYFLYDILSNDTSGNIDTQEQILLFDSLPWAIKQYFKDAMKRTIQYTNELSNFDNSKIPIDQQICLMKVSDNIKEKAMQKAKELKNKTEDTGTKARQYLDGLLKIPFNIFKREPIFINHILFFHNHFI